MKYFSPNHCFEETVFKIQSILTPEKRGHLNCTVGLFCIKRQCLGNFHGYTFQLRGDPFHNNVFRWNQSYGESCVGLRGMVLKEEGV